MTFKKFKVIIFLKQKIHYGNCSLLKNILGSEEKVLEILNEVIIEVESQSHKSELYRNEYIDLENIYLDFENIKK